MLDAIDAIESWLVLLPLYFQIPLLLVVVVPLAWYVAKVVDLVVQRMLRWHTERTETAELRTEVATSRGGAE